MSSLPTAGAPPRFCLYHAGNTPVSARAIVNTRRFCDQHLGERYELEIVDISMHPERARDGQIVAAPTLVKLHPPPLKRAVGDMSSTDRLAMLFGLPLPSS